MAKRAKKLIKSPLSKEQIVAQMEQKAVFEKRMKFIKEKFWVSLCETADTIEDATMFLSGFNTAIMQSFLEQMKGKPFKDLKLDEKIAGEFDKYKTILALFEEMDVFQTKEYVEGMRNEIALFKQDEDRVRKLTDLKPKWIDELAK